MSWLLLCVAGGAGAVARSAADTWIQRAAGDELPLGTLAINLSGALALGILAGAGVGGDWLLVAGTGALGSFTTFSTWMFEAQRLAEDGDGGIALGYLAVSVAAGFGAVALGWALGSAL